MTAICDAFAHGANNVANATGPFEIVLAVYLDGEVRMKRSLCKSGYL
ncbi:unnamed protein product [Ectocarpus sp. 12 AP-2014]